MTSFHNVRLPEEIESGAQGGPGFKTTVLTLSSGFEKRNIEWSRSRGSWDISYGIQTKDDVGSVIDFFYARRGKAYGFRFKDWTDFEITNQTIGTGDGVAVVYQVFKNYQDDGGSFQRKITRIVDGTLSVYVNAILKSDPGDYTVDIDTGLITFGTAPGAVATSVLTSSSNYSVGETVVIGGKTYTFESPVTNVDGHVLRGGSEAASMANLHYAINKSGGTIGTDYALATTANAFVTATDNGVHALTVTAITGGAAGNAITTAETCALAAWGPNTAYLTGGADADVTVTCEFDVPVRFDTDKLPLKATWEDAIEVPQIPIVEIKE